MIKSQITSAKGSALIYQSLKGALGLTIFKISSVDYFHRSFVYSLTILHTCGFGSHYPRDNK